jgi:predicted RNase H-like nuclease (RuvC/YqgF family)
MKLQILTVGMLSLAILSSTACVTRATYNIATAEFEKKKAEIDSTNTQLQALTEQVRELEEHKAVLDRQMEAVSSLLQRAKQQAQVERKFWQERTGKLNRTVSDLTAEQKKLRDALQRANKAQPALQLLVETSKTKLDEVIKTRALQSPPSSEGINQQTQAAVVPPQGAGQTDSASKPIAATVAASVDPNANDQKTAPKNKPTPEPVEDGWLSIIKEWVASIWESIFSLTGL